MSKPARLRDLPAVETVLRGLGGVGLPRAVVVALVRRELAALRRQLAPGRGRAGRAAGRTTVRERGDSEEVIVEIRARLETLRRSRLQPVINGTGVILHTNLGRAPLAREAVEALGAVAAGYSNLEFDLATGERGARAGYLEHSLAALCGAEAATVVNNCAAALVLILRHFTAGDRKQVVISRGELIQIGGGFRIPEILESSGAVLREVGTTNRTTVNDYARALGRETALVLKVHRSNFFMGGFVESASTGELTALARRRKVAVVEDLGSGAAVNTEAYGAGAHEPTPKEVLDAGVDLVCFSGDKLLGGPQAGIIAGKSKLVAALKRDPFFRALRCDKLVFAALQATVDLLLDTPVSAAATSAAPLLPALQSLATPTGQLRKRASQLVAALNDLPLEASEGAGKAQVGGGTLPKAELESVTLDLKPRDMPLQEFAARLRAGTPPVIGYVGSGRFKLDLRTVFPHQDGTVARVIRNLFEPTAAVQ